VHEIRAKGNVTEQEAGQARPLPALRELGRTSKQQLWEMARVPGSEPDGDDGHKATGGGALFAVGEEEVGVAGGAEVDSEDVFG
jgi:hypothetical protein